MNTYGNKSTFTISSLQGYGIAYYMEGISDGELWRIYTVIEMNRLLTHKEAEQWPLYKKLPVPIHAIQSDEEFQIFTLEGLMTCRRGDYIVQEVDGEFYPVKKEIFEKTYEKVDLQ